MSTFENDKFEESQRDAILDSLSKEDEDKLRYAHSETYTGTDDDMSEQFENWLLEQPTEIIKNIIK